MKVNIQNDLKVSVKSTTSDKFHYSIQTGSEKDLLVETFQNGKEVTLKRPDSGGCNSGSIFATNVNNSVIIINGVRITGNINGVNVSVNGGNVSINGGSGKTFNPLVMTLYIPISESAIELNTSDSSEVSLYLDGFSLDSLNLDTSGSSVLSLFNPDAMSIHSVVINTSGSSELLATKALNTSQLLLNSTGSSSIILRNFKFNVLDVNSTGSSSIVGGNSEGITVTSKASGSSSIRGFIAESLNQKTSGSASISIKQKRS